MNNIMNAINNNNSEIDKLIKVLDSPFKETPGFEEYASAPINSDNNYVTYCGT